MRIVPQRWGREVWFVNNELYCYKELSFNRGGRCSLHKHKIKTETFIVSNGLFIVAVLSEKERASTVLALRAGDTLDIPANVYHCILGVENENVLLEVSTHHEDSDSYRLNDEMQVINIYDTMDKMSEEKKSRTGNNKHGGCSCKQ
jgi:quercetin dioxygenase-like cupin family protein